MYWAGMQQAERTGQHEPVRTNREGMHQAPQGETGRVNRSGMHRAGQTGHGCSGQGWTRQECSGQGRQRGRQLGRCFPAPPVPFIRCRRCSLGGTRGPCGGSGAGGAGERGAEPGPVLGLRPGRWERPVPSGGAFVVGASAGGASAAATKAERGGRTRRRRPPSSPAPEPPQPRGPRGLRDCVRGASPVPGMGAGGSSSRAALPELRAAAAPSAGGTGNRWYREPTAASAGGTEC